MIFSLIGRFFRAIMGDSRSQYVMNKWLMWFWIVNLIGVQLVFFLASAFWQKASILYLADISVYACIGQHYTGIAASLAGRIAKDAEESGPSPSERD